MARLPRRSHLPALALAPVLAVALALAGAGHAAPPSAGQALIDQARADLVRGDGIAAEVRLKQALSAGAKREAIAARMGEAMLLQGQRDKARDWLAPGRFTSADEALGFRMLGRLELLDGKLEASGAAYDRVIALTPRDPQLWVDVGQLRYAGGEHKLAIDAADYALSLDPDNVAALLFKGQFVRDQYGLAAALPWFEAALERDPENLDALGEYAATLGDLGRAREMLAVTRTMLMRDGGNPRALFLQALLAARAGDAHLARAMLNRTRDRLRDVPAKVLLDGIIELRSGNNLLAIEAFERLVKLQPANPEAQAMLARAYYAAGDALVVTQRFADLAARSDASPQLLTTVARAHEVLGQRDLAAALLDRAASAQDRPFAPVPENQPIGALLSEQQVGQAEVEAEQRRRNQPGSSTAQSLAGDVQLTLGRGPAAAERYREAAQIRLTESLLLRMVAALGLYGQGDTAGALVENFLSQNPSSRIAARLAAGRAAALGDWPRARALLETLRKAGGGRDVRLLADLSMAQLRSGDPAAAEATSREAYRLQPASAATARAWGMSLTASKQRPADAAALLAKAQSLGG